MSFDIPPFILRLTLDSKIYAIEVTQTFLSDKMEIFTLTYKQRTLLMLSNRPFIRGKNLNSAPEVRASRTFLFRFVNTNQTCHF